MNSIHFQLADSLQAWCIGISLFSLTFLVVQAVRRKNRARLVPRILLLCLAILGISMAVLQPACWISKTPKVAILETEQAKSSVLDSLVKVLPGASIINYNATPDLALLFEEQAEIRDLHIVGDGLPSEELDNLQGKSVHFYLNGPQEGIIELNYTRKVKAGKLFQISGTYFSDSEKQHTLSVESPSGKKEIHSIDGIGAVHFKSDILVKKAGHFLFHLVVENKAGKELKRTPFPVQITENKRLKVLILNHAPNFETKYLKNWLADKAYEVAVRSSISTDKFKTEFHNTSSKKLAPVTQRLLNQFDLLVLQASSIEYLNRAEQNQIIEAVKDGLGLCFIVNQHPDKWNFSHFKRSLINFPFKVASNNFSLGEKEEAIDLAKTPISIIDQAGLYPIMKGEDKQIIAAYQLKETGKVSLLLLPETYLLPLAGKNALYEKIWSPILEKTARVPYHSIEWEVNNELLLEIDRPAEIQLYFNGQTPIGQLQIPDSTLSTIYFKQNPFLATQWNSQFWPNTAGWYEVSLKNESQVSEKIYLPEPNQWAALKQSTQVKHNQIWAIKNPPENKIEAIAQKEVQAIPLWWFYLLFLVAAGALWLEEKL